MELFDQEDRSNAPLADRMRPRSLDEYVGQAHLVGPGSLLRTAMVEGHLFSMIFWGPPGSGKTTLARLVAADIKTPVHYTSF
jgi:putative ATPase